MSAVDGTTDVDLTANWKGASGNDLYIEVEQTSAGEPGGTIFTITQPAGGLVNPDVQSALDQMGDVWESQVINCLDIADTTNLDKFQTFGEGRWGALTRKPLIVHTGNLATTVSAAIVIPDARKTDRVNSQRVAPGSKDLPFITAARQVARIAVQANNNPAVDYARLECTGLTPGKDSEQWLYNQQDLAVKSGSSTTRVVDGVVQLADSVMFYHPTGEDIPGYRFVKDIVALQQVLFTLDVLFNQKEWDGAPLVPDGTVLTNPAAKTPNMAKNAWFGKLEGLVKDAILTDEEFTRANTQVVISDQNQNRLDFKTTIKLAGNLSIISIDLDFGFYFGTAQPIN
jgi:phage tail sheath gpL-like